LGKAYPPGRYGRPAFVNPPGHPQRPHPHLLEITISK